MFSTPRLQLGAKMEARPAAWSWPLHFLVGTCWRSDLVERARHTRCFAGTCVFTPPTNEDSRAISESSHTVGRVWGVRASWRAHGTLGPTHAPGMHLLPSGPRTGASCGWEASAVAFFVSLGFEALGFRSVRKLTALAGARSRAAEVPCLRCHSACSPRVCCVYVVRAARAGWHGLCARAVLPCAVCCARYSFPVLCCAVPCWRAELCWALSVLVPLLPLSCGLRAFGRCEAYSRETSCRALLCGPCAQLWFRGCFSCSVMALSRSRVTCATQRDQKSLIKGSSFI